MNPGDPLAALHPLRQPEPISWWPPAPGWWLLAAVLIAAALFLARGVTGRRRRQRYRREALAELARLRESDLLHSQPGSAVTAINATLKRAAITAAGRERIAALHGAAWVDFLNGLLQEGEAGFEAGWFEAAYRPGDAKQVPVDQVLDRAEHWLRRHRSPAC